MNNNHGNVLPFVMIIIGIILMIFLLVIAIFLGTINGMIHQVKTEMYCINRAAIISVNKNRANIDQFSYHEKEYEKYFKKMIQKNFNLNDNLENPSGVIQKVTVEEYRIYTKNQKDSFTKKKAEGTIIHTLIHIQIKPIFMIKPLENLCSFQVHEDVFLEMAKHE